MTPSRSKSSTISRHSSAFLITGPSATRTGTFTAIPPCRKNYGSKVPAGADPDQHRTGTSQFSRLRLFCWTEVGAEAVGIVLSLIAPCRLQGVDPRSQLEHVLQRDSARPSPRVEEPAPRRWMDLYAGDLMKSALGTSVECRASNLRGAG
ncbi:MAG: hypothetical protein OXI87_10330 [Albidovulum sp.]|nr:hypothetical protein [Albidovulum sp.]